MRFLSLFAGIGGFDIGLERAGHTCVGQVEHDPDCIRVLERWWPDVPRWKDVREVGAHNLPAVDLICGGWPCQDLSVAGARAGLAGQQSGLFYEFARIVAELHPRWVLAENVPGLLSSWSPVDAAPDVVGVGLEADPEHDPPPAPMDWEVDEESDHGAVVAALVELGYGVAWRVLDAQYFGLAQRRDRVFVLGHLGAPWSAPGAVLLEPESVSGNPPPGDAERQEATPRAVAGTLGGSKHRYDLDTGGGVHL